MRLPLRLLAGVKPERFLEAGNPTGLTGLFTHPKPRRALIYFYEQTLEKLKTLPENSVYRQSAEAITRRRLKIVESEKPDGFDDWFRRTKEKIENHASKRAKEREQKQEEMQDDPFEIGVNREFKASSAVIKSYMRIDLNSRNPTVYIREPKQEDDENEKEWNGLPIADDPLGEPYTTDEQLRNIKSPIGRNPQDIIDIEAEPPLEASQIRRIEDEIGGGLIEEVIQVAEAELKLVDSMAGSKVWEPLEEKAPEGQWEYFARDQHTTGTQAPPK